jgi:hypothetical protein
MRGIAIRQARCDPQKRGIGPALPERATRKTGLSRSVCDGDARPRQAAHGHDVVVDLLLRRRGAENALHVLHFGRHEALSEESLRGFFEVEIGDAEAGGRFHFRYHFFRNFHVSPGGLAKRMDPDLGLSAGELNVEQGYPTSATTREQAAKFDARLKRCSISFTST